MAVGAVRGNAAARLELVGLQIGRLAEGYSRGELMDLGLVRKRTRCLVSGGRGDRRENISFKNKAYCNLGLESKDFRIPVFSLKPNGFSCSFLHKKPGGFFVLSQLSNTCFHT